MQHKLVALLGGADAARIAVALIASLGVHAGAALWMDGWSQASRAPVARSVQVRLTHAPAREVLAGLTPEQTVPAAIAPALTALARPASALAAVVPASIAAALPVPGAVTAVTGTPVTARPVRRAAPPAPRAPAAASRAAPSPPRVAVARPAPAAPAVVAPTAARVDRPRAASRERAVDTPPQPAAGNAPPRYPSTARRRGQQGEVLLRVQVLPDGTISSPAVVRSSGVASLDQAAQAAVSRWRFTPASSGGRAVEATVEVPVVFRLDGPG